MKVIIQWGNETKENNINNFSFRIVRKIGDEIMLQLDKMYNIKSGYAKELYDDDGNIVGVEYTPITPIGGVYPSGKIYVYAVD